MREIRLFGSEGGEGSSLFPYPYQNLFKRTVFKTGGRGSTRAAGLNVAC